MGQRRLQAIWVFGAILAAGCTDGEATDSAAPSGSATLSGSTGADSDDGSTTGPTTAGVTSALPTGATQSSNTNPTASDPTLDPTDSGGGCQGCLNAAGICESGEFNAACGRGGSECVACEGAAQCAEGVCESPPECGPDNCNGCCDGDDCIEQPTNAQCGADGAECTTCDSEATCTAGACELPCEDTCFGCCTVSGECIDDGEQDATACGFLGLDCETCVGDQNCDLGVCSSPGCIETCDGCCIGDTCYDGFDDTECGFQETCEICSDGLACDGFDCTPNPNVQWQVVLLDGEIVATQPGGGTWDAFFGAPDPYLDIDELGFESMYVDNTLDPVWNATVTSAILTPDLQVPLTFRMRDSDVIIDQLIGTCTVNLPDSAFGGLYEVTCDLDGDFAWSVLLSIQTVEK